MRPLGAGLVLALVLAGGAGGYLLGTNDDAGSASFSGPEPVAAESPSYPVNPVVVLPDPDEPALAPGIPLHRVRVGTAPFDLSLPVPRGWVRSDSEAGEWRWYPPPRPIENTHFLRVRLIGNQYQTLERAITSRIEALRSAESVADFRLLTSSDTGFVAVYVSDGYRRVAMESFVAKEATENAYAWIAMLGRRSDMAGIADVFTRVVAGVRAGS